MNILVILLLSFAGSVMALEKLPKKMSNCYGGSQYEMNECARAEFDFYDRLLNKIYKEQMDYLQNDPAKKEFKEQTGYKIRSDVHLKAAQVQWVKFRDADCFYHAGPEEDGGSIRPLRYYRCMAARTKNRALEIESYVKCRENGCNI